MADAYRGLTIQIGGDTTKLSAALRAAKKAATETQAQLRLVSKAARFDPENITLAANKLKLMGNVAEDLGAKLRTSKEGLRQLGNTKMDGAVKSIKQVASETENAALAAQHAHDRYNKVDAMLERLNTTLNKQAKFAGADKDFDVRKMGVDEAIASLKELNAITIDQADELRYLKALWHEAFDDKAIKDKVVEFKKLSNEVDATEAEIKKLSSDMASLSEPTGISKGFSSLDKHLAQVDAQAKYLSSDLEKCEAALRLDPSNMDAARRKMADLGASADLAAQKAALLKEKLDGYESSGISAAASEMGELTKASVEANAAYAESLSALKTMQGRLSQLKAEQQNMSDDPKTTSAQYEALSSEIAECESQVKQLKAAEQQAASARETANAKKEYAELAQEMQQAESQAKQLASSMERVQRPSNWTHMKTLGMTLSAVLTPAMERFGSYALQSATDIDTAYRNMRKTVQGSEGDFQKLKQSALEFSSVNFASADQILAIQAIGGELGVATESLDTFAQTASNLDIATDLDAETSATALGQLDNILGDLNESTMPNFADSLVRLGNNGASTESQILDIATRIGSMASIVGMATPDMLALSSTIASTGQNAEAAGTAISKTMSFMETAVAEGGGTLSEIAATANMSADRFAAAWEKRPLDAITAFIKGLNQLEENGGSADLRLQELGITAVRQKQAIEGLMQTVKSQNGELSVMDANAQMASDAWNGLSDQWGAAGDAAREAEAKNEGFAGSVQRLKNTAQNAASEIADSLAPAMDDIADAAADLYDDFSQASDGTKQFVAAAGVLAAGLGPGLSVIATMGTGLSDVSKKMKKGREAFSSLTKGVDAARMVLGPMASQADVASLATEGLTLKMKAANIGANLMKTGLLGLKVAAVTLAVAGIGALVAKQMEMERHQQLVNDALTSAESIVGWAGKSYEQAAGGIDTMRYASEETLRSLKELNDQLKSDMDEQAASERTLDNYIGTIEELGNKGSLTAYEQEKLKLAVEGYNEITGDSITVTDEQTGALSRSTEEIKKNAEAWKERARAEAYSDYAKEYYKDQAEAEVKLAEAKSQLTEAQKNYNKAVADQRNASMSGDKDAEREAASRAGQYAEQISNLTSSIDEYTEAKDRAAQSGDFLTTQSAVMASELDQSIKDAILNLDSSMQQAGLEAMSALSQGINENKFGVDEALQFLNLGIAGKLQELPPEMLASGYEMANMLAQGMSEGKVNIDQALLFMDQGIVTAFAGLPVEMQAQGMNAISALASAIDAGQIDISQAAQILSAAASGDLSTLPEELQGIGGEAVSGLASSMAAASGELSGKASELSSQVSSAFDGLPDELRSKGDEAVAALATAVASGEISASDAADILKAAATGSLEGLPEELVPYAEGAVTDFANAIAEGEGPTEDAARACAAAADKMGELGDSYTWGYHLSSNLAKGIRAGIPLINEASADAAAAAAVNIQHSTPKEGPLKDDDVWGLHLAQNFANGILKGVPLVEDASLQMASAVHDYIGHTNPSKGPLSQGEWIFGYHAAVNFADGLYSGVDEAANAAESVADAAEKEFQEYIDKMIAGYEKRGDEMIEVSTEMAEAIWGVFLPMANAEEYVKPFTGAVYDSMKVLESAGMTLDQYASKMEDMAEKKADWDKKMAASDVNDSTKESYADFMEEYNEFLALQSKLSASMEDMREWQGLYKMKDTLISSTTASEDLADALWDAGQSGATFSKEFLDYVADGGEDAVKALSQLTAMGPDALQEMSDSFRDMAIAEKEAEVNAKSLYVNSLAHTNFKTQREQMLEFRDTVLDVREAMYSDDGLSNAFKMTGTSAEGFAADLMSVGMTMEDFKSQYADFTSAVSNGFSQMTKYNQTSLEDWERNLKLNMAEAQEWSKNLQEVFAKVPESIDSEAFRKAILEGGFDTWGKVIDEMAQQTPEQIAKYIELYNESMKEAQISGIEAFKALAPGEEMVQAIIDGMGEKQDDLNGAVTDASGNAVIEMLNTAPQWESAGATVAGALVPGIMSQANAIAAAAAAVVSQAIAAAQAAASGAAAAGQAAAASYKASAQRAASPMMMAAQAAPNISTANTVNMTFTVNQQPGQSLDVRQLAKQVVKIQDREMRARGMR